MCTAAKAYNNEHGRTYIMIFGQGQWFGEKMEKSLINLIWYYEVVSYTDRDLGERLVDQNYLGEVVQRSLGQMLKDKCLDNEASDMLKQTLNKHKIAYQLVSPHLHH